MKVLGLFLFDHFTCLGKGKDRANSGTLRVKILRDAECPEMGWDARAKAYSFALSRNPSPKLADVCSRIPAPAYRFQAEAIGSLFSSFFLGL